MAADGPAVLEWTTANGGHADAIGVAEVEPEPKVGLPSITSFNAVPSARQISRKAIAFGKQSR